MKSIAIKFLTLFMLFAFSSLTANESAHGAEHSSTHKEENYQTKPFSEMITGFLGSTGLVALVDPDPNELNSHGEKMSDFHKGLGRVLMILVTFFLFWLAIARGFEPLLLLPIAFGGFLANIPIANIAGDHGFLGVIYNM